MGVYIKGMEMPTSCGFCKLRHADTFHGDSCSVTIGLWCEFQKRPDNCPLVLVPPHGRLGDLDRLESGLRLMAKYQYGERQHGILGCCETIRLSTTIIPAEEG